MRKIVVGLLTIFVFHASVQAADKIRIGIPSTVGQFMTLPLAQKKGFFKEEEIDAEIIQISGPPLRAAIASGELDYSASTGGMVRLAISGMPVKVVACFVPAPMPSLIARPEYKSILELKGKTIGINTFGGSSDILARMIVKHFGLDPEREIRFVAARAEARFAMLSQGLIDATVVGPPFDFKGSKLGFNVLVRSYELFTYPESGLSTNIKRTKERPDEVKRVIRAGIRANRYIRANREGTIQFLIGWLRVDREEATATYDSFVKVFNDDGSMPEEGLRLVIEDARKAAKVNREVALSEVLDLSILREAQKELGIK